MNIQYNYKIISVNEAARCMEIIYSSEGRKTMHIGARLPYDGEVLEDVIRMYAPTQYWAEQELTVVPPEIGLSGDISYAYDETVMLDAVNTDQPQPTVNGAETL